jgi:AraC-like DNA-binding protein
MPSKFAMEQLVVSDNMAYLSYPTFYYNRNTFDDHLLLYVIDGIFHVEQYGRKFSLKAGDCIMMTLTDAHKYYSDRTETAQFIFFHFKGVPVNAIISVLKEHKYLPIIVHDESYRHDIMDCFRITDEYRKDNEFEFILSGRIYETIIRIATPSLTAIRKGDSNRDFWFINTVESYINDHIYERIEVSELSKALKISVPYLYKIFSSYFYLPPYQYILKKKIFYSMKLLSDSDDSINGIAYSLGFTDQSHYCNEFKKIAGFSPLQYRNSIQSTGNV